MISVSLMHGAERRLKYHPRENPIKFTHRPTIGPGATCPGARAGATCRRVGGVPGKQRVVLPRGGPDSMARRDSGMDMRQDPWGPRPRPDDDQRDQDDEPFKGKEDKSSGLDLGALERDLLEY